MRRTSKYLFLLAAALLVSGCHHHKKDEQEYKRVMILYSAGFNSLSNYLKEDITDLKAGYVPKKGSTDVLLVAAHHLEGSYVRGNTSQFKSFTAPCLIRLYTEKNKVVCDTLWSLAPGETLVSASNMRAVLSKAQSLFPAGHFGMVYSSHATGWLPSGYYDNPSSFEVFASRKSFPDGLVENADKDPGGQFPVTKSVGEEKVVRDGDVLSSQMELEEFAAAIPMHLDYLLFDACLMGGAEVAYALRKAADYVAFSQAEVLAEGFNYELMTTHLLKGTTDPVSVCDDYYQQYVQKTGDNKAATISMVDCSKMDALAAACKQVFAKYSSEIASVDASKVQTFFGGSRHWYYDLEDALVKAGVPEADLAPVRSALSAAVVYANHTGQYVSSLDGLHAINAFCGLSIYLPSMGTAFLDNFYKGLSWNAATGLVQ